MGLFSKGLEFSNEELKLIIYVLQDKYADYAEGIENIDRNSADAKNRISMCARIEPLVERLMAEATKRGMK